MNVFVVMYKWKVKPEKQETFREGWKLVTEAIQKRDGSLGARLHQLDESTFIAYAQWPTREHWEKAWRKGPAEESLGYHLMKTSLKRRQLDKPFLTMILTDDCLDVQSYSIETDYRKEGEVQ